MRSTCPPGTDVKRLRRQIGELDREVHQLRLELAASAEHWGRWLAMPTLPVRRPAVDRLRAEIERNARPGRASNACPPAS